MASDDRYSEENSRPFVKYTRLRRRIETPWVSAQAPGTPPQWDALFSRIRANDTEGPVFRWLRKLQNKHSDEFVWEAYEAWCNKKVLDAIKS